MTKPILATLGILLLGLMILGLTQSALLATPWVVGVLCIALAYQIGGK